jgi:hypothetical protein
MAIGQVGRIAAEQWEGQLHTVMREKRQRT